jgi:hypothetical protein
LKFVERKKEQIDTLQKIDERIEKIEEEKTTILSTAEISSFEAALSLNTGGQLTTLADACAFLVANDPPTVAEARTFLISAGISHEHPEELIDCLVLLGLLVAPLQIDKAIYHGREEATRIYG